MPVITVLPLEFAVPLGEDETLLAAARRLGCQWPSVCGGIGQCTTCVVRVEAGAEHLSPMEAGEAEVLSLYRGRGGQVPAGIRMACQLKAHGDAVVFKRGVRRAERQ